MEGRDSRKADTGGIRWPNLVPRDPRVPAARQLSTRRQLLIGTLATGAAIAGGATLAACGQSPRTNIQADTPISSAPLPPPETTTVRIVNPVECDPAIWVARDSLLRDEGFTDVRYVDTQFTLRDWINKDLADVATAHPEFIVGSLDAGLPITMLTGLHSGCLEVWAKPGITSIGQLRGKRISIRVADMSDHFYAFFATLLGYVRIDAHKDVQFVETGVESYAAMLAAFIDGRADAVLAGAAAGPYLRSLHIPGNVIFDQAVQKPWSSYLCCTLVANRTWAERYPIAAKRVTRAILAATDAAARDHTAAAHAFFVGEQGQKSESITMQTMAMCNYNWRDYEPEDTLRFFALRLNAAGLIKSTPQQLIDRGTSLAYMRQLRTELKS